MYIALVSESEDSKNQLIENLDEYFDGEYHFDTYPGYYSYGFDYLDHYNAPYACFLPTLTALAEHQGWFEYLSKIGLSGVSGIEAIAKLRHNIKYGELNSNDEAMTAHALIILEQLVQEDIERIWDVVYLLPKKGGLASEIAEVWAEYSRTNSWLRWEILPEDDGKAGDVIMELLEEELRANE